MNPEQKLHQLFSRYGMSPGVVRSFRELIYREYKRNPRDFAWRKTRDPYSIVVSEVMLQQTQTSRVREKYERFLKKFPNLEYLAKSSLREILIVWQGLGYNRRAIKLKELAEVVIASYDGKIPSKSGELEKLPGIGPATAAAICAFAYSQPTILIETNIRRVYIHFFFKNNKKVNDRDIKPLLEKTLDRTDPRSWYYALMDYGVKLGTEVPNPNRKSAHYIKQSTFKGSDRQVRGLIIKILIKKKSISTEELLEMVHCSSEQLNKVLTSLKLEGFIRKRTNRVYIA